jgi:hypothetical protein
MLPATEKAVAKIKLKDLSLCIMAACHGMPWAWYAAELIKKQRSAAK